MDISDIKSYEPLFGCWRVTDEVGTSGYGRLFALERTDDRIPHTAVLRAIFLPRKRRGILQLMEQMQVRGDPAAFVQEMALAVQNELNARKRLTGVPGIVACYKQQVFEREDKTGIDVLLCMEALVPLEEYLGRNKLSEPVLLRLGIDICGALEACREAGVQYTGLNTQAVFVTEDGRFKLGRLENTQVQKSPADISAEDRAAGTRTLTSLLRQIAEGVPADAGEGPSAGAAMTLSSEMASILDLAEHAAAGTDPAATAHLKKDLQDLLAARTAPRRLGIEVLPPLKEQTARRPQRALAADEVTHLPEQQATLSTQPCRPEQKAEMAPAPSPVPPQAPVSASPRTLLFEKIADTYEMKPSERPAQKHPGRWLWMLLAGIMLLTVLSYTALTFVWPVVSPMLDRSRNSTGDTVADASAAPVQIAPPSPAPAVPEEPALLPAELEAAAREERIGGVLATVQDICTGTQPQIKDPATWNEAGKALMDRLEADPYYQEWGFTATAAAFADGSDQQTKRADITAAINQWQEASNTVIPDQYPYLIAVNRAASTVTVYTIDEDGRYTVPYMAMVCSGGPGTPTGFWFTPIKYQWRTLVGPCYGQNATRIWDSYLFHSVPYYTQHKDDVEYDQFNQLGTQASLGCIRLAVVDVKWIFDNCPLGTPVVIYDDETDPGPMGKPGTIYTDPNNEELRGWDPTDPDEANPWDDMYLPGTAIRSEAAWEEYNAAMLNGRWNDTINVTDLQGWSTDSSVAGTRG